jgi:OmpA-OmpF porin, OOP family
MKTSHIIQSLAVLALGAAILLPNSAVAYPKQGWYVGLGAGVNFEQDSNAKIGAITNKLEFDPGFLLDGSIGYGFESQLRPEFEVAYRQNGVKSVTGATSGVAQNSFNSTAFMGNLLYDFQTDSGFTPYIGGGLGGALVGANDAGRIIGGQTLNDQSFQFAYQGIAGMAYELSENFDLTADYRYFRTLSPKFVSNTNASVSDATYANHAIMMGLRYTFGEERPLPAPVPMRAAPRQVVMMQQPIMQRPIMQVAPPPPPVVPETYIVFFDFDKYYLTSEAKETIQRAADAYRRGGVARVEITGHTDTRGSNRYNKRLSDRRARMVRDYMASLGVPQNEIDTHGAGESDLMVPTADNVRETKNRRAEIILRQQ